MLLDKLTGGEEHVDRQRPAVNPEPRYLAEQKHKAMLERPRWKKLVELWLLPMLGRR